MEQKNEQSVYEVMTKYAGEVIARWRVKFLRPAILSRHLSINMKLSMSSYYLRPIKNDRSRVFHRVHSQIGAYLSENQEKLDIKKTRRLMTRNPFGRENEVQEWRKKE